MDARISADRSTLSIGFALSCTTVCITLLSKWCVAATTTCRAASCNASPPPRVSVAAAFLDGLSADAIDDHVSWSERLQDREAALQREIEKQAARDAAASWAWP